MIDSPNDAKELTIDQLAPAFLAERTRLNRIDRWYRWDHDQPHSPRHATREYQDLATRAQTPLLGLVVTTVAQNLYVEGYRSSDDPDNSSPWASWQANGMDSRQIALHRAALAYGESNASVLPGVDPLTGDAMAVIRGISPRNMSTFWLDMANDDYPVYAIHAVDAKVNGAPGWDLRVYDDRRTWKFLSDRSMQSVTYVEFDEHDVGVCPIVRYCNSLDLEGRVDGEVDPFIPVAARIDQTTFDRIVVQRFASWKVRTIAGMTKPETLDGETEAEYLARTKLRLMVDDILVASDPDTKFGTLDETPLDGFIKAAEFDIRTLAAVSQTPAHEMLGGMINLSAEALAAARASLSAKVDERRHMFGESHEKTMRLAAAVNGDEAGARDTSSQVRWKDTEIRSLAQASDALGKLAQMLGVPVQMLWEKIPGFTQQDVDRAKALAEQGGSLDALMRELANGQTSAEAGGGSVKAQADALGVMIRAGVSPESAAERAGMSGVEFTGAVPVSLRLPETDAAGLEQG